MLDDNWETVNGPVAHRIEVLNATNQINVLEGLVTFLLVHRGPTADGVAAMPDEASLKQLHRSGTMFLLASPGEYRNHEVHVGDAEGNVRHKPPPWQFIPGQMQLFFRHLSSLWASGDALDVAAYTLWGINWVHPFRNGNGRTARAFSYACLSLKIGAILPGTTTVIDQIMANRPRYEDALLKADESFKAAPHIPDLAPMKAFLDELLQIQIASIPE
ncbi:Fic family protein [Mesorhizobium sp. ANAO-SY3R2]|uniref:Fic family protein n=1 Tax=Mesorhizobium sp. ANAO-SY3R2 TaxID=3166644 RepID=UPI003670FDA6